MKRLMLLSLLPVASLLLGFTPFTPVTNVCPKCPSAKSDVVTLTSGVKVPCTVVAQNDDYYVVSRHGELRPVEKSEVSAVSWKQGKIPTDLTSADQVLLKNGVAFYGVITQESAGRYLIIQLNGTNHVAWFSQVQSVHKGGKLYTPPAPGAAGP